MKPNCEEMSWEEVAAMLDGANNILAQNFNQLTEEYSRLLIQIINDESVAIENIKERKARLRSKCR
ncbi:MAG: hypothetical protein HOM97_05760 [Nitrospina sp.]|jgi:hypothetical protein|nr:hypothetical protein [Nitrospina sp.]